MDKETKKLMAYGSGVTLIVAGLLIAGNLFSAECYAKEYIFVGEYLAEVNYPGYVQCDSCLWIEAMEVRNAFILGYKDNPPANSFQESVVKENTKKFFFVEKTLTGIKPYSLITMQWCKNSEGKYRIRGVWEND